MSKDVLGLYDSCVRSGIRTTDRMTSEVGSQVQKQYKLNREIMKDGSIKRDFVVSGSINIYDMIQSHRDSVDLAILIKRYEQGDEEAFNRVKGFYMDTVGMPKNYAELFQRLDDARNLFDQLPADMREEFNNNPEQFMSNLGSYVKGREAEEASKEVPKESEVKADE